VTTISLPCTATRSNGVVIGRGGGRFAGYIFTGVVDNTRIDAAKLTY
jgi:hypothetical protein